MSEEAGPEAGEEPAESHGAAHDANPDGSAVERHSGPVRLHPSWTAPRRRAELERHRAEERHGAEEERLRAEERHRAEEERLRAEWERDLAEHQSDHLARSVIDI